ncbi:glycogen biosynthesis protein GlgD [Rossellomorea vietnamensis]|uniref:Glycogen biosynthesis protein GlgD n=1 Tax=Rossellomorea vietnamensis TaxID=218284 RepID=A0A5D4P2S1_9BACI|nr:glycogen biosynthesis protein GlgD [Rossellomorea vietnamensis]TYS19884.1 glycogen biosynthesis protein GlgD [Rossellomorea vietnamensis]
MKKRSKQNNPEQKTRNAERNLDTEFGKEYNPVKEAKKRYEEHGQPVKSKNRELDNK